MSQENRTKRYDIDGNPMYMTDEEWKNYREQLSAAYALCRPKLLEEVSVPLIMGTAGELNTNWEKTFKEWSNPIEQREK